MGNRSDAKGIEAQSDGAADSGIFFDVDISRLLNESNQIFLLNWEKRESCDYNVFCKNATNWSVSIFIK